MSGRDADARAVLEPLISRGGDDGRVWRAVWMQVAGNDIRNVVFLSTDIHGAIINNEVNLTGLSPGPRVRELVSGAIGMDPIYRELPGSILAVVPALPSLFPTIQWFDIDRFNVATVSVDQTQAEVHYYDNTGADLKTYTIPAT